MGPKKILVCGGAGFIGSHFIERLIAEGHEVDVVDNLSTGSLSNLADARSTTGRLKIQNIAIESPEFAELVLSHHTEDEEWPWSFEATLAYQLSEAGLRMSASRLVGYCRGVSLMPVDMVVVEGAGGWRVPINSRETLADVARELECAVIVVVGMRLGCLNHALLTMEAIRRDGLQIAGWVANILDPEMPRLQENIDTLKQCINEPCLGTVPRLDDLSAERVADFLTVPGQ